MNKKIFLYILIPLTFLTSCGNNENRKKVSETTKETKAEQERKPVMVEETITNESLPIGIGPISKLELEEINTDLAEKGKEHFKAKCTACHKMSKRYIGPSLKGITERRSPEWIMNMIMNPMEMIEKDPTAIALLKEYSAPMADQNITEKDSRAILEFFRVYDNKNK